MIVLGGVGECGLRAHLIEVPRPLAVCAATMDVVRTNAGVLGVAGRQLSGPESDHPKASGGLDHTWSAETGALEYRARFPHHPESIAVISRYSSLALTTAGEVDPRVLGEVRLCIYELIVNCIEHGEPQGEDPTVRLILRFEPEVIRAVVEDDCVPFDVMAVESHGIGSQIATRARRGYGLTLVRAIVDDIQVANQASGNRISFERSWSYER